VRTDIDFFARDLDARGRARAAITRRLCTVAGFYRCAVEEELLENSPAAHVRRPRPNRHAHGVVEHHTRNQNPHIPSTLNHNDARQPSHAHAGRRATIGS